MSSFIDWVFPTDVCCFLCAREAHTDERGLCGDCAAKLRPAEGQPCPAALEGFCAGALMDAANAAAIHHMKYDDARYLAPFFAKLIEVPHAWPIDVVIPVPLHENKRRQRGYNQSALIAHALAGRLELPFEEDWLSRVRDTGSQTQLSAAARAENVAGAFIAKPGKAAGKHVLIVDDVLTTGATMNECAMALRRMGAAGVYGATALARALQI